MKVAFFSAKEYDRHSFDTVCNDLDNSTQHEFTYFDLHLNQQTVALVKGFRAVCVFVNDILDEAVLDSLSRQQVEFVVLRCAGFNNVDLAAAEKYKIKVARVPRYSPYAVAEHTLTLILNLLRKVHISYHRVREGNFSLTGLLGGNLHHKTVGLIGTGYIGAVVAKILKGFDCRVIAYDPITNPTCVQLGVEYKTLQDIYVESDIISLHCPLNKTTHHLINEQAIAIMKQGVMLINTSRGAVVDTQALVQALKNKKIAGLALDVYEQEENVFFEDLSNQIIEDDILERLMTFPNVIITGHQGFFTSEALKEIAYITFKNLSDFESMGSSINQIKF